MPAMNEHFKTIILNATGADELFSAGTIQELWSGYGSIVRYNLTGAPMESVVVKHVRLPDQGRHPRGWNTGRSHERKIQSYQVETAWYERWSKHCSDACHVPACLALESHDDEVLMVLEDLNATGFPARRNHVSAAELKACLSWMAHFHATFMGEQPAGLWPVGTYWHLETRPDELNELDDPALKQAAGAIDHALSNGRFQTFVHGDAKLANFCFSPDGQKVAAVDFQYVGGGCGMKDVAYFLSSCLNEDECERQETPLLDYYFQILKQVLSEQRPDIDADAVEQEWRTLYPMAWTDFFRFLQGWSPGHWKIHSYSERLAREVLEQVCR